MKKALAFIFLLSLSCAALASSNAAVNLHAFSPPAGDAAVAYLRQVFGTVVDTITANGNAQSAATDSTLGAMLQPFNSAVLFVGMLYMVYTTVKGTVDSAHDGEFLGARMSSVWVPIRAVAGTGMLLPLASGYSLIQVLVLWLAIQGVGIGDATLSAGLDYVTSTSLVARPNLPETRPLAANILRYETCMAAMNKQYEASGRSTRITEQEHSQTLSNTGELSYGDAMTAGAAFGPLGALGTAANALANATYTVTDYQWAANDNSYTNPAVCGAISWQQSAASSLGDGNTSISKAAIMQAHANAVHAMIASLRPVAEQIVAGQKPAPGAIEQAAATYENTLFSAAKSALDSSQQSANRAQFIDNAKSAGWLFVATWYNQLIQLNDSMQSALNTLPSSKPVNIDDKEIGDVLVDYRDAMTVADEYIKNHSAAVQDAYDQQAQDAVTVPHSWEDMKRLLSRPAIAAIHQFVERLAGGNMSHVAQVKSVGDTIIGAAEAIIAATFTATGMASSNAATLTIGNVFNIGAALSSISGMLTSMVISILFFGAICAYYIPMIPYISGITAVIKWFVLVFESVIAAQLFGVAHAHPEGHDAVGHAGPGYMLLLGVTLRPALTVLGFFGSIWLAQPISEFVNLSYATAVAGAEHNSLTGIIGFIAYVAIYAIIMTTVMHGVFTLTNWVPDNVLRWIGGRLGADGVADREPGEAAGRFEGGVRTAKEGFRGGLAGGQDAPPTGPGGPGQGATPDTRELMPVDRPEV
ncbi:DotA/TraY family protein [Burkholderia stagnalis]|uniref:DotA/TraY family protein n=1 Tax=Burkholderia stagnalis TaxID=1503054 RepID=UPI000F57BFC3|nr:DotA/TraY family protein [Burkholderia stagnalis]RQR11266.1 conjugal transfer protein TraY [Burkholderia stagnalis]RQR20295.1 conjugal transfer protein TraY [Burkholderia stagnalis]